MGVALAKETFLCNHIIRSLLLLLLGLILRGRTWTCPAKDVGQHASHLFQNHVHFRRRPHRDPQTPFAPQLLPTESGHHAVPLRERRVDGHGRLAAGSPGGAVANLDQEKIGIPTADDPPHARDAGEFHDHAIALREEVIFVALHHGETLRLQRRDRECAGGGRNVVAPTDLVQERGDGWGGEGAPQPDPREPKSFAERLHDHEVGPFVDPFGEARAIGGKINVGFVQHHDAVPGRVFEDLLDV